MSEVFLKLVSGNDANDAEDIMAVMLMVVLFCELLHNDTVCEADL